MRASFLFAVATTLLTASAGGFKSTCTECRLGSSNTLYGCLCADESHKQIYSIVDLNKCLVNSGGTLIAQANGNFGATCTRDGGNDQYSPCWTCGNGSGTNQACPDLNSFLSNHDGTLSCDV